MSEGAPLRLLFVEDEENYITVMQMTLNRVFSKKVTVTSTHTVRDAVTLLKQRDYDVILLDLQLPDSRGIETVVRINEHAESAAIVVLTGYVDESLGLEAVRRGAQDYLVKGGFDEKVLSRVLRYAIERKRTALEKAFIIKKLEEALSKVKTLTGLLPICAYCKSIRNDDGYWKKVEDYFEEISEARFSHGICPDCVVKIKKH
ncbi:MAG: response regulator [Candidatus Omnitrophota bacterium]|nr:response regulator [Candidatus Omnitrophota bacterium]